MTRNSDQLPRPSSRLAYDDVVLQFVDVIPADTLPGSVPCYHFRIVNTASEDVGSINLRIGDTHLTREVAGHLGYRIHQQHRGNGYAAKACLAVAPLATTTLEGIDITITCDLDNVASIKTIERIGGSLIDEIEIANSDGDGVVSKRRYRWNP